jgi:2-phospho-L-lactate/phosphoenolpyruvate guanylyltransferase
MLTWAIIPIKPLYQGKSRLSGIIDQQQRIKFNKQLLAHTLRVVSSSKQISGVIVVTKDMSIQLLIKKPNVKILVEDCKSDLNKAINLGISKAIEENADSILVIPCDLPLLNREEIRKIIALSSSEKELIIVPDRHLSGTNMLFIKPALKNIYCFGENSFEKHKEMGRKLGLDVKVYQSMNLCLDIDVPEDLRYYNLRKAEPKSGV